MRARSALIVSGTRVELREIVLRDKPDEMLTASPKGSVPVLVLTSNEMSGVEKSGDTVIDESWDIMLWALRQNDPQDWLGKEEGHIQTTLPLLNENDTTFKELLDRYKYPERHPEQPQIEYRIAGEKFLQTLEQRLNISTYLSGSTFSIADATLLPFIRQFAAVDNTWFASSPYPALRAWLERYTSSELFGKVMQKYPVWAAGSEPVFFG